MFIDFHAHHAAPDQHTLVVQDGVDTRGRHPWHLSPLTSHSSLLTSPHLLAIGESGLDRLCPTPYDLQLRVFREEVALSETLQKPLILHCVRAIDDVLRIRRELHARQPIVWHGYRGGATQLLQLLKPPSDLPTEAGRGLFFFSFGPRHNAQALAACPPDRLLLETDDLLQPIAPLYATAAALRGMEPEELVEQMHRNFRALFGREAGDTG